MVTNSYANAVQLGVGVAHIGTKREKQNLHNYENMAYVQRVDLVESIKVQGVKMEINSTRSKDGKSFIRWIYKKICKILNQYLM